MTILYPKELHEAIQHAIEADSALDSAIFHEKDEKRAHELEKRRGQAVKTLLSCLGYRANSDNLDNQDPVFPGGSEVVYPNGMRKTIYSIGEDARPIRETFIFSDFAPYSFFFRELYIDPHTREQVDIYDRCWYVLKEGPTQSEALGLTDEELDGLVGNGRVLRFFHQDKIEAELAKNPNTVYVERMKRRIGMCGGIIYHPDYTEYGTKCPYGSYSTHT